MRSCLVLTLLALRLSSPAAAQVAADTTRPVRPHVDRFYVGSESGLIFSTATISYLNTDTKGAVRFTAPFNLGITINFNPGRNFGVYSGIDVKNVGFIMEDPMGGTAKYRTYNIGVPLGIKIGNMAPGRSYLFLGGGIDAPVNYKEKHFVNRAQKTKFSEWFSDRTPAIMPYVFAGVVLPHGLTFKIQYYLSNFLNPEFTDAGRKPYETYNVHVILFSLGRSASLFKKHDLVKERLPH